MTRNLGRVLAACFAILPACEDAVVAPAIIDEPEATVVVAEPEAGELDGLARQAGGSPRALGGPASPATVQIRLPERFRVITRQQFDLRVEASGLAAAGATVKVYANGFDVTGLLGTPELSSDNDEDPASLDQAWTYRNLHFALPGVHDIAVVVKEQAGVASASRSVNVQPFDIGYGSKKNVILYIGDAMGTAYRDSSRLISSSVGGGMREGFFDQLQAMDSMPVAGMVMTYSMENVVPDSAPTASAWATGSKTVNAALGVFPDNNDWRFKSSDLQATKQFALDNPRIETLWELLKRRHGYKTGIVTTSDVTDATPAGEAGHTISRGLGHDIARQYVDGVFTSGAAFDVILGGGKERFEGRTVANSGDTRNLTADLVAAGWTSVGTRSELNALAKGAQAPSKLIGLFRTSHMNVTYDKLGLVRPADEPNPDFAGFTNQPFLDEMTARAIDVLNKGNAPFILLVEGASIDKQSHSNHAAGQLWDTIELDKAVKVGRDLASKNKKTLVLVSADHDQSLHIIGVVDTQVPGYTLNIRANKGYTGLTGGVAGFPDYEDVNGDGYPENTNRYRLAVGYRTGDHTGSSVPITAEGPGALLFTGYYDQTEIFFKMAAVIGQSTSLLDLALTWKDQVVIASPNY